MDQQRPILWIVIAKRQFRFPHLPDSTTLTPDGRASVRKMAKRKLLKEQDRRELFDIPVDEDSLIRHFSLSPADRLEIELRRRDHNLLGFAIQLCLMRYPGRVLGAEETPPRAMLKYVADQIGADQGSFAL